MSTGSSNLPALVTTVSQSAALNSIAAAIVVRLSSSGCSVRYPKTE
jgi:hypothetical protein